MQAQLLRRLAQDLAAETGLSAADYEVLVHLSEADEGRLRPFELCDRMVWEGSRLSHQVSRMGRRGLVERQPCGTDNRGSFVVITRPGRRAIAQAAPVHVAAVRRWFVEPATSDQLTTLTDLAEAVLAGLDAESPTLSSPRAGGD